MNWRHTEQRRAVTRHLDIEVPTEQLRDMLIDRRSVLITVQTVSPQGEQETTYINLSSGEAGLRDWMTHYGQQTDDEYKASVREHYEHVRGYN